MLPRLNLQMTFFALIPEQSSDGVDGLGSVEPHHQLSRSGCEQTRWSTLDRVPLC